MRAQTILRAIVAMRAADSISYATPPEKFGNTLGHLMAACIDLEIELGALNIEVQEKEAT